MSSGETLTGWRWTSEFQKGQQQGSSADQGKEHKHIDSKWTECSPEGKNLRVLVNRKFNMTQKYALAHTICEKTSLFFIAQTANNFPADRESTRVNSSH